MRWSATAGTLVLAIGWGPTLALADGEGKSCAPPPKDVRVVFAVRDGSAVGVAEAMACLLGLMFSRSDEIEDLAVTIEREVPLTPPQALTQVNRVLRRMGATLKVRAAVLSLEKREDWSGPVAAEQGRPVHVVRDEKGGLVEIRTAGPGGTRSVLDQPEAVKCTSPRHCVVSEEVRRLALEDPMTFLGEGEVTAVKDGPPRPGFLVTRLREGGFFERLGLRTGDLIFEVNGRPLRTTGEALAVYSSLRNARVLVVRLVRGGERVVMVLRFAPRAN